MRIFGYNLSFGKRASNTPPNPLDDRWYTPFMFTQPTASGAMVNPVTALTHPAVYACVKIISETLAAMPLILYKRKSDDSKDRATDHPLFRLLKSLPNPRMTAFEFREMLVGHYLLRGNAYAQIIYNQGGDIDSLWPLHPGRMEVLAHPDTGEIVYKYTLSNNLTVTFTPEQILHLRGPSDGGLMGRSPIDCFKEAIGTGLSMEAYESNLYGNNASPTGLLTLPPGQSLSKTGKEKLSEDWQRKFAGVNRAKNVAVLEDGLTWQQVGMTSSDAQFVDSKKANDQTIARVFRMPPHKIGIMGDATFSNIEQQNTEFYTDTILPHLERFEQVVERDLLRGEKPDKYYAEFLVDSILRGDILTRGRYYAIARQWGWMNVNEIRAKENQNPVDGGEIYLQPLNMIEAAQAMDYLLKSAQPNSKQPGTKNALDDNSNPSLKNSQDLLKLIIRKANEKRENDEKIENNAPIFDENRAESEISSIRESSIGFLKETISRLLTKENKAIASARKKENFTELADNFYQEHETFCKDNLRSAVLNYIKQVNVIGRFCNSVTSASTDVDARDKVVGEAVKVYYDTYREAGDKISQYAEELSNFIVDRVDDLCLWELN